MKTRITDMLSIKRELERLSEYLQSEQVIGETLFHSKLVFSELVGNILRHSKAYAEVESKVDGDFVHLYIRSSDGYMPPKCSVCSDVYAENGRGLFLVDTVSYSREEFAGGIKVLIKIEKE